MESKPQLTDEGRLLIAWATSKRWTARAYFLSTSALRAIERHSPLMETAAARALVYAARALGLKPDLELMLAATRQ